MEEIKKTAIVKGAKSANGGGNASMLPVYSVPDLLAEINPNNSAFLKYMPDELLSDDQLASKAKGIQDEEQKLSDVRKATNDEINRIRGEIASGNLSGRELSTKKSRLSYLENLTQDGSFSYTEG